MRLQPSICYGGTVRRILAVPRGRVCLADRRTRCSWDVEALGGSAAMVKNPVVETAAATDDS